MNETSSIAPSDTAGRSGGAYLGLEPQPRSYQSWVADETIEDYALRYAPASYRRWSPATRSASTSPPTSLPSSR